MLKTNLKKIPSTRMRCYRADFEGFVHAGRQTGGAERKGKVSARVVKNRLRWRTQSLYGECKIVFYSWNATTQNDLMTFFAGISVRNTFCDKCEGNPKTVPGTLFCSNDKKLE